MAQHQDSMAVQVGTDVLRGKEVTPRQLLDIVGELKKERAFGLGRKLLDKHADDPAIRGDPKLRIKIAQQLALCTYKDPDLLSDERLDTALQILKEGDDLDRTTDRESLGLAGAIYKRTWVLTGQERDLEQSLAYYERGYETGRTEDYGWTGINAAFVLDLLADHESTTTVGDGLGTAELKRKRANEIRQQIASTLPSLLDSSELATSIKQALAELGREARWRVSDDVRARPGIISISVIRLGIPAGMGLLSTANHRKGAPNSGFTRSSGAAQFSNPEDVSRDTGVLLETFFQDDHLSRLIYQALSIPSFVLIVITPSIAEPELGEPPKPEHEIWRLTTLRSKRILVITGGEKDSSGNYTKGAGTLQDFSTTWLPDISELNVEAAAREDARKALAPLTAPPVDNGK